MGGRAIAALSKWKKDAAFDLATIAGA